MCVQNAQKISAPLRLCERTFSGLSGLGYCRVSTEDQAKEGVSLDNQKSKIEAYCHLKDMWFMGGKL
ncbi:MAG: recombinase family protein [Pseudomonadota bacterium]